MCGQHFETEDQLNGHITETADCNSYCEQVAYGDSSAELWHLLSLSSKSPPIGVANITERVSAAGKKEVPFRLIRSQGDCLFDCAALYLFLRRIEREGGDHGYRTWMRIRTTLSEECRSRVSSWLAKNKRFKVPLDETTTVELQQLIPRDEVWAAFAHNMGIPGVWAELPCLIGLAQVLRCDVGTIDNILGAAGGKRLFKTADKKIDTPLELKMTYENHYSLLVDASYDLSFLEANDAATVNAVSNRDIVVFRAGSHQQRYLAKLLAHPRAGGRPRLPTVLAQYVTKFHTW